MERWNAKRETTRKEEFLLKRLHRTGRLFGLLRRHQHELLDEQFQIDLEAMYRHTDAGQDPLPAFRERLISHDMDRRPLERTAELARGTKEFDWKKPPKVLRMAIDSSPLECTGRVEDMLNLLAHAALKMVECAADPAGARPPERARGRRTPARAPRSAPGTPRRSLPRRAEEPLRPTTRFGHPEPESHPA